MKLCTALLTLILVHSRTGPAHATQPTDESKPEARATPQAGTDHAGVEPAGSRPAQPLALPPLPDGVVALDFKDFFVTPVGPRGVEMTAHLKSLEGKRVRLLGYMVEECTPTPGCFLLTPRPIKLHEHEYGHADELPMTTVHVFTAPDAPQLTLFTPGPLLLTGTLELGQRVEPSGRPSIVRLRLDSPTDAERQVLEARLKQMAGQETHAEHDAHHDHAH